MQITVNLYRDEFNTHKQVAAAVLEEVLTRLPWHYDSEVPEALQESRSQLYDTLFDDALEKIDTRLKEYLSQKFELKFDSNAAVAELTDLTLESVVNTLNPKETPFLNSLGKQIPTT